MHAWAMRALVATKRIETRRRTRAGAVAMLKWAHAVRARSMLRAHAQRGSRHERHRRLVSVRMAFEAIE
ncbi:hypothetical protein T484DRAFT_1762723, partial [Baffinella frigidus]